MDVDKREVAHTMTSYKVLLLVFILIASSGCEAQKCEIRGTWKITKGSPARNFERAKPYKENRITFSNDSVELASGFFYNIANLDEDYPEGRYPFIFYGKKEKYKVTGDSLYLHTKAYKEWRPFKIKCIDAKKLILVAKDDSIYLERDLTKRASHLRRIKYIRATVHDGDLGLYKNRFEVLFTDNDKLAFRGRVLKDNVSSEFALKPGTFASICEGFAFLDLKELKKVYESKTSEINEIALEIGMSDGQVFKTDIQNMNCPDELRLALVPVLYTHQQYLYPDTKPVR